MAVKPSPVVQPAEQLLYARLIAWGTRAGLAVLVLSFAAYLTGLSEPHVPLERLPELWSLPLANYLEQAQVPTGWGWLALIRHGDIAALSGIVILAGCSALALLALVAVYLRQGDRAYAALCLAEAAVVLLAASGLIGGGH